MRPTICALLLAALCSTSAAAQPASRWYAGVALGTNVVTADPIDTSPLAAAGGIIGVSLTRSLSIEVDVDRGFGELSRVYQGIGFSFAPQNSTREEIERLGVTQRFEEYWKPGLSISGGLVWHAPSSGRVSAAVFGGVTHTPYDRRRVVTVIAIPTGIDPNHPSLRTQTEVGTERRGGLTGGLLVPIALARSVSVAPGVQYTYGSIGDEIYNVFRTGVRLLWRF